MYSIGLQSIDFFMVYFLDQVALPDSSLIGFAGIFPWVDLTYHIVKGGSFFPLRLKPEALFMFDGEVG